MRAIKRDLRDENGKTYLGDVKILPLADFHIGDPNTDLELIHDLIGFVEETPHCYTILNGDLMNTAITNSVSDSYEELMKPSDQLKRCVELFGGLAEQGKILGITDGNHERRITRNVGVNMTEILATQLGLADAYSEGDLVLFLKVGINRNNSKRKNKSHRAFYYSVFARHGAGGGALKGGKVNRLQRFSDIIDCDVYIGSHTHDDIIMHDAVYRVSRQKASIALCDRTYVNTPSALNYGGYGEIAGFRPQSNIHWPVITLHGNTQLVTVES